METSGQWPYRAPVVSAGKSEELKGFRFAAFRFCTHCVGLRLFRLWRGGLPCRRSALPLQCILEWLHRSLSPFCSPCIFTWGARVSSIWSVLFCR